MSDALTPLQSLALGVCAARWRLGEPCWTFERQPSIVRALGQLERLGLIWIRSGPVESDVQAWITDAGKARVCADTYRPPNGDDVPTPLLYRIGHLHLTRVGQLDRWRVQDLAENGAGTSYLGSDGRWSPMGSGAEWQELHWHTWDRAVELAKAAGK
jgi:hypothetical protein